MHRSWNLIPIVLILLVAAAVRFHLLGAQSFWHDEGNSYIQATRSFSQLRKTRLVTSILRGIIGRWRSGGLQRVKASLRCGRSLLLSAC